MSAFSPCRLAISTCIIFYGCWLRRIILLTVVTCGVCVIFGAAKTFAKSFEGGEAELALFINCFLIACQPASQPASGAWPHKSCGRGEHGQGHACHLSSTYSLILWLVPPPASCLSASQQLVKSTFNLLHMAKTQLTDTNAHSHPRWHPPQLLLGHSTTVTNAARSLDRGDGVGERGRVHIEKIQMTRVSLRSL